MKRKIVSIFLVGILLMMSMIPIVYAQTAQEKKKELESQLSDAKEEKAEVTAYQDDDQ